MPDHPIVQPHWDGQLLELQTPGRSHFEVRLDGTLFAELHTEAAGRAQLQIPFSPSGRAQLSVRICSIGDSEESPASAFAIEVGKAEILPMSSRPDSLLGLSPIGNRLPATARPMQPEVAIIVPVYNAAAAVKRCLDSVLVNSSGRCRLIVIDDASTEPEIAPLLSRYRGIVGVEILSNPVNLGFTATVNRGMALAGQADIVLLNADTEVAGQWLTGLRRAAYSADDIATATAVSNNAGAFSVPELERENVLPPEWNFAQTARAHWQSAGHAYPQLPTGNGFCMYIRRNVLDRVGLFDVEAFPQGYGEENDFCQRACAAGFRHLIAGNVLVLHERSMSFGTERREALGRAGMQVLRKRWPNYESDVGRQLFSFERRVLDWRVRRIHAFAAHHAPRPRLLRFCSQTDPAPESGYDIHALELDGNRLRFNGNLMEEDSVSSPPTRSHSLISAVLEGQAIEMIEIEQGMNPQWIEVLQDEANRLGVPAIRLIAGERATSAQRKAALHSMNRFESLTR